MVIKYYWQELTSEGLLRQPDEYGAYYDTKDVNNYGGFDSEEEALMHMGSIMEEIPYGVDFVLVKVFSKNW